jgi:hypothetical protein
MELHVLAAAPKLRILMVLMALMLRRRDKSLAADVSRTPFLGHPGSSLVTVT